MIKQFTYNNFSCQYELLLEKRQTLSLLINADLTIKVRCPQQYSQKEIDVFLQKKWQWIDKHLQRLQQLPAKIKLKYTDGEKIPYLGELYPLQVIESTYNKVLWQNKIILIHSNGKISNKKLIELWYKEEAKTILFKRYHIIFKNFNYSIIPQLKIKKMKSRWGSFTAKNKISLNSQLIKVSLDCLDYVITHELCHFRHRNHSKKFYAFQQEKYPNWQIVKKKLALQARIFI